MSERRGVRASAWAMLGFFGVMLALGSGCDLLGSKKKKAFGEACVADLDCETSECATYGSICSKSCTYDKDCGGDLVCRVRDSGTGGQCAKPAGTPPGANSTCNTASECQNAQCLRRTNEPTSPGICSKYCQDANDCPAGMKICDSISDSGALKLCLPGDASTPASARPVFVAPKPVVKTTTSAAASASAAPSASASASSIPTPSVTASASASASSTASAADAGAPPSDAGAPPRPDAGASDGGVLKPRPKITIPIKK